MVARLLVCATCDRYAAPAPSPTRGEALAAALRAVTPRVALRVVECLNGCPRPCTAGLRAPGKATLRFSGLGPQDAAALLALAERYDASPDGEVVDAALPESLRGRLTVHTPAPRP